MKSKIRMPSFVIGETAIFDGESWLKNEQESVLFWKEHKDYPEEPDPKLDWFSELYYTEGLCSAPIIQVEIVAALFFPCICCEYDPTHEDGSQKIDNEGWFYRVKFRDIESSDPRYDESLVQECFLVKIRREGQLL